MLKKNENMLNNPQDLQSDVSSPMSIIRQLMSFIESGNVSKFQTLLSARQLPQNTKNSLLNKSFSLLYNGNNNIQKEIIELLLSAGANPNIKIRFPASNNSSSNLKPKDNNLNELTPLILAVKMNDYNFVKLLIEHYASVNNKGQGKNCLFYIFDNWKGDFLEEKGKIVNEILSKDPNLIDEVDPSTGKTLLMEAVQRGSIPLSKLFLEKGANVASINSKDGNSVMHYAVMNGNMELIEILIEFNKNKICNLGFKNSNGETPLDIAMKTSSQTDIYRLLAEEFTKSIENNPTNLMNNIFQESIVIQNEDTPNNRIEISFTFKDNQIDSSSNEINTNANSVNSVDKTSTEENNNADNCNNGSLFNSMISKCNYLQLFI